MYVVSCHKCGRPGRLVKGKVQFGVLYSCVLFCPADNLVGKLYPPEEKVAEVAPTYEELLMFNLNLQTGKLNV